MSKIKGKYGEGLAKSFLEERGFEIIEVNFRHGRSEIDIIALKDQLLVFVEVKMRSSSSLGDAESFASENQQNKIIDAAEEYIQGINWQKDIRFDIIAIHQETLEHIKDAFY